MVYSKLEPGFFRLVKCVDHENVSRPFWSKTYQREKQEGEEGSEEEEKDKTSK